MKCKGCENGLPLIVAAGTALHYTPGTDGPDSVCSEQNAINDPIAGEVTAWEGEGGRIATA